MSMIDRALKAAGIDLDAELNAWVDQHDDWHLDAWLADNPPPHTKAQDAELSQHMARRVQIITEFWDNLPAETRQRIDDAIEADRRRWAIENVATGGGIIETAPPGKNPEYVHAALKVEFDRLANATEGHRNDQLLKTACSAFEFVKAGHAEHDPAWAELRRLAHAIGLMPNEIEATLRSAWRRTKPRQVPARRFNGTRAAATFDGRQVR